MKKTEKGPDITKYQVVGAIKQTKIQKVIGPDQIPIEIIKLIEEQRIGIVVYLYNTIYIFRHHC